MHPSSLRAFKRHQEHDLKHHGLVDLITTKQNKTNYDPSLIDGVPKRTFKKHKSEKFHASFMNMVFQKKTFKKHKYEKFHASLLRNGLYMF
jgi:hypothetical protein